MKLSRLLMKKILRTIAKILLGGCLGLFAVVLGMVIFLFLHSWQSVVILQNSDELRATGGFFGSLVSLQHQGIKFTNLEFSDVYHLDGQISTFPPAPVAVRRYLSGGVNALHLQDANWERDFPTSAQTILSLLKNAGSDNFDFLVAVNSRLITNYLAEFGTLSVNINGVATTLDEHNFTTQARQDHEIFNPQRQNKTVFLQAAWNALQADLRQKKISTYLKLASFLLRQLQQRQIQIYALNPLYQRILKILRWSGHMSQPHDCQRIYFVESNVGINKSNAQTATSLSLKTTGDKTAQLEAVFTNSNQYPQSNLVTKRLHYANYQRLFLPPGVNIIAMKVAGEASSPADYRQISDSSGHLWQEAGFLLMIAEGSQLKLEIDLAGETGCFEVVN